MTRFLWLAALALAAATRALEPGGLDLGALLAILPLLTLLFAARAFSSDDAGTAVTLLAILFATGGALVAILQASATHATILTPLLLPLGAWGAPTRRRQIGLGILGGLVGGGVLALTSTSPIWILPTALLAFARPERRGSRLEAQAAELARVAERLVRSREAERARLARELHDETGQLVHGLRLELDYLGLRGASEELAPSLQRMSDLLDRLVERLRATMRDLRPRLLDDAGLVPALEALIEEVLAAPTDTRIEADLDPAVAVVDPVVAICVYRIAQEALTNAMRHAQARTIWGRLALIDGRLRLEVEDDGIGARFDDLEPSSHGVANMRERAALLGAELVLLPRTGGGTRVALSAPPAFQGSGISSVEVVTR